MIVTVVSKQISKFHGFSRNFNIFLQLILFVLGQLAETAACRQRLAASRTTGLILRKTLK